MSPVPVTDRPLASGCLTSYRYLGAFGWIMIGATDSADALREAGRSLCRGTPSLDALQVWDGCKYQPVATVFSTGGHEVINSMKKAIARIQAGAVVVKTISQDARSSGSFYSLSDTGEGITAEAVSRLMPKLAPLNDGLLDGESQTFTLRPDA